MHPPAPVTRAGIAAVLAAAVAAWPAAAHAAVPSPVCVIDDPRAIELSGLVATRTGYVAINDSQFESEKMQILYLDGQCRVTSTLAYPTPARDPEDLAVAPDGTLWVADTGDNVEAQTRRETVALWLIPSDGGAPVIHRLTYPDGAHDAEALLFAGDGTPVIITKETTGVAGLYVPTGPLRSRSTEGVPLKKVGEFRPVSSGENNQFGTMGELMVTGAATAPDRSKVALRTFTAAYEWDVSGGDVVKAITTLRPRLTGLPDEPQGEAMAYTTDGTALLTVSDELGPTTLRHHELSQAPLETPPPARRPARRSNPPGSPAPGCGWPSRPGRSGSSWPRPVTPACAGPAAAPSGRPDAGGDRPGGTRPRAGRACPWPRSRPGRPARTGPRPA